MTVLTVVAFNQNLSTSSFNVTNYFFLLRLESPTRARKVCNKDGARCYLEAPGNQSGYTTITETTMHSSPGLLGKCVQYMSLVVRKPAFCICENKDADQLRGNREADQRLCFRYTDSTIPLLSKSKISSL